jgi:iron complex outermembrane recepter protein
MNLRDSLVAAALVGAGPGVALARDLDVATLKQFSLEELMDVKVTMVSRREESLFTSPAAVHVVTADDIRALGSTTVPDLLRVVPGLQVAQIQSANWAISSRGFADSFANKLLVMIDGRSVYTPLYSGVFWEVQDTLLQDLDRIEVVRGPGGTLWGANAVNGIINIRTKSARDTQGMLLTAGGGTETQVLTGARYGFQLSEQAWMRVYGQFRDHDRSVAIQEASPADEWHNGRGGFRLDWEPGGRNLITLSADIYNGEIGASQEERFPVPPYVFFWREDRVETSGGNVLGRWTHDFSDTAQFVAQTYYDRTTRDFWVLNETRNTWDVDLQHRFRLGTRHDISFGAAYRYSEDRVANSFQLAFDPVQRGISLYSGFVQDEIQLWPDRLKLTIGSKLERNDFTGWEVQPSARLAWTPSTRHTFWASVSRAVRTPSRGESDFRAALQVIEPPFPSLPPIVISAVGSPDYRSEILKAYEAGYRIKVTPRLSFDLALYYHDYLRLRSVEPQPQYFRQDAVPFIAIDGRVENNAFGSGYGAELVVNWEPADWWRLQASYSLQRLDIGLLPGSRDTFAVPDEGRLPQQQVKLLSTWQLPRGVFIDAFTWFSDEVAANRVPAYVGLNLQLRWQPRPGLEVALTGQNLLDPRRSEWTAPTGNSLLRETERGIFGRITWRY